MAEDINTTELLQKTLGRFQANESVRKAIGILLVAALIAASRHFLYDLWPRRHHLTITGGEITSNRHFLAKVPEEEARAFGVEFKILPTHGSIQALEMLEAGQLDLALSQGGLEPSFDKVVHVATLAPELIHFIVRPEITAIADLRGKVINLGNKAGGTRIVGQSILRSSGLEVGVDYVETNFGNDRLLTLPVEQLPDVVVNVSFQPSFLAEFLVKERGYKILELPFPGSLALRMGWVADATIQGYTYGVDPAVPDHDIKTVGANLHLLANAEVPARSIQAVLESLYSPTVASRTRLALDEANILHPSGFPISPGTLAFAARKDPFFDAEMMEKLKALAGLAFSIGSGLMIAVRWFRGKPVVEQFHDDEIRGYIAEIARIEARLADLPPGGDCQELGRRLAALRGDVLGRMGELKLGAPSPVGTLLLAEAGARDRLMARVGAA